MSVMNLNPQIGLSFDGQCEAAFKFYQRCLNGKIAFMLRWGESPMAKDAPAEWSGKILHGRKCHDQDHQSEPDSKLNLPGSGALPGPLRADFPILLTDAVSTPVFAFDC